MLKNTLRYLSHRPSRSVGFLFSISSLLLGIWVAALPEVKIRLGLTDATLGLSLLLAPLGAISGMVVAPKIFKRMEAGRWLYLGSTLYCFVYVLLVWSVHPLMLWVTLYFTGLLGFLNGVSCNAVVDLLEKKYERKMMSTSHAMYSLGGGISAALASVFYSFKLSSNVQILLVAGMIKLFLYLLRKELLANRDIIHSDSTFQLPTGNLIGLAFICFVTFMGEGCVADWSAIYLKESMGSSIAFASLGFVGFSLAMALGRLNGDLWIPKVGAKRMIIAGSLLASFGFLLIVIFSSRFTALAGFTLVGLGFSCIVPILFSAAANIPGMSAAAGISAVASGGLLGFLAGPSLIGIISEQFNLATGLALILFLAIISAWIGWKNQYLMKPGNDIEEVAYPEQLF
jgi:MFS family permease